MTDPDPDMHHFINFHFVKHETMDEVHEVNDNDGGGGGWGVGGGGGGGGAGPLHIHYVCVL
jgi:hypothetical protein